MANPFLVLGGIAVGIVVAAMGVLQVPGWVKSAQDASAINDLSNASIGEAVAASRLGEYLSGPELVDRADELGMSFELPSGVKVCVTRNDDRTAYAAVALSPSGAYFARVLGSTEAIEATSASDALAAAGGLPAGVPNPVIGGDCAPDSALPTPDSDAGGPGGGTPEPGSDPDNQPFAAMFTLNCDVQTEVSLPIRGNVAGTATWSDGHESQVADGGVEPRVLEAGVTYQVMFDGTFVALTGGGGLDCFRSMDSWSDESGTQVADGAFAGMTNLTSVPANLPPTVFLLNHAFAGATSFNDADVARWDVSNVTHAINVFDGATAFQQDINGWTFRAGGQTQVSGMFANTNYGGDLRNWTFENEDGAHVEEFFKDSNYTGDMSGWAFRNNGHAYVDLYAGSSSGAFNGDISGWTFDNTGDVFLDPTVGAGGAAVEIDWTDWVFSNGGVLHLQ